jgi:hypothetical protein
VADALYIAGIIAFFAVMLGFVFLYDRSAGYAGYDVAEESSVREERGARPI